MGKQERPTASADIPISVVIAASNAAPWIAATIAGLKAQTYVAWEAIVVENGSSDDTLAAIEQAAAGDDRFRVIQREQAGVSAARNVGIEHARGRWLYFLDADDRIEPTVLERLSAAVDARPDLDFVRCGWAWEAADGRVVPDGDEELDAGGDLFEVSAKRCPTAIHAVLCRRSLIEEVGGFDTGLAYGEDWDLWQRLARRGVRHHFIPETLVYYRLNAGSASNRDPVRSCREARTVIERGHAPDPRVANPLGGLADGARRDGLPLALDLAVVWAIGSAIGSGQSWSDVLDAYRPERFVAPELIADVLFEAVPLARGALPYDWPEIWGRKQPDLEAASEAIATWFGRPGTGRAVMRSLERRLLLDSAPPDGTELGASGVVDIDLGGSIADIETSRGIEQLVVRVNLAGRSMGCVTVPALGGSATAASLQTAVTDQCWPSLARAAARRPLAARRLVDVTRLPTAVRAAAHMALDTPVRGPRDIRALVRGAIRSAVRSAFRIDAPRAAETISSATTNHAAGADDHAAVEYWESVFASADPWGYTSSYEQTKYAQTLELLGTERFERALEVACAEGHFTVQLAPLVGSLTATDISPTALERAAERCAAFGNITYRQLDLRNDALPDQLDLLVCSECLYFLDDSAELAAVAARFAAALAPGGRLLTAHARLLVDEPDGVGFGWNHAFGAKRIGEVFATEPGLSLVSEIVTDLYIIQLYERTASPLGTVTRPTSQHRAHGELDAGLRRMIWSGAVSKTREGARVTEVTNRLPILAYRDLGRRGDEPSSQTGVTSDQFEAQLDHLRSGGYYGITVPDWRYAMAAGKALPGRAVMLTFDGAYRGFADVAWPLLGAYGFPATLYVVAEAPGTGSSIDSERVGPGDLMGWGELRHLHRNGVHIGSLSAAGRALTALTPDELVDQEHRGRAAFERELGLAVVDLAYPLGAAGDIVRHAVWHAGYHTAVTTQPGWATIWDDPLAIPRLDITGDTDLDSFVAGLGTSDERHRVGRGAKSVLRRLRR
ncbi:MAG TPA: trifunctional glycosyltransferase/class I SAM-dependent methyltransferase/polysaccharide deacetylase [Ilumatobacter sp.]|nr:trifunctional glycosyltransferase/class I SAM-dependent methyltransferase/polysaccharide deacetylase [Ilumatobacter sp.]